MVQYGCKVQIVLLSLRPSYYRLHERQDQLQEALSWNLRVRSWFIFIYIFFDTEDYKLSKESVSQRCTFVLALYLGTLLLTILCDLNCVPTTVHFPSRIPLRIFAEKRIFMTRDELRSATTTP